MGLRALMVGINDYAERPLKGCVNDTILMRDFLKTQRGVPDDQLRLHSNAESTRAAIVAGLAWLAAPDADEDSDTPSVRLFHFAGHGIQQADENGDEPDGSDECLLPIDHASAGVLTDDVLSELYSRFPPTTQLVLLIDSCHSGTIHKGFGKDIRYRTMPIAPPEYKKIVAAKTAFQKVQLNHVVTRIQAIAAGEASAEELEAAAQELIATVQKQSFGKPQSHENVILLAACKPEQTAADANFGGTYHGAMTFFLNLALQGGQGITYQALAEQLRREMYDNKFAQVPQLEGAATLLERPFLG